MPLLPAFLTRPDRQVVRGIRHVGRPGSLVTMSIHPCTRRSGWATRGLASHTELPKSLRTIPTYIVYDNVTQCFGHELMSGAMRFSTIRCQFIIMTIQCQFIIIASLASSR